MKLKIAALIVYAVSLLAPPVRPIAQPACPEGESKIITLNAAGARGIVLFDHKAHEGVINPDAQWPHRTKKGAACVGCHHTRSPAGIPQLWKCHSCHRGEANPINPKNRDYDEVFAERAFHDTCIGCHRATNERVRANRAPTTCGGCHRSRLNASTIERLRLAGQVRRD